MEMHGIAPNVMSKWCQLLDINIDIDQLVADLLSALLTDVGVDILRKSCGSMTKIALYRFDVITCTDGGNSIAVTQIVICILPAFFSTPLQSASKATFRNNPLR